MQIAWYDIIMAAVLVTATLYGAWKGSAWQLTSLTSIVVGYFIAYRYHAVVSPWIPVPAPGSVVLAMLLLFLLTSWAIWAAFRRLAKWLDRLQLRGFDHRLGALLGLAKGTILCVVITFCAVVFLGASQRQAIVQSTSGYCAAVLLQRSRRLLPAEAREVLELFWEALEQSP